MQREQVEGEGTQTQRDRETEWDLCDTEGRQCPWPRQREDKKVRGKKEKSERNDFKK